MIFLLILIDSAFILSTRQYVIFIFLVSFLDLCFVHHGPDPRLLLKTCLDFESFRKIGRKETVQAKILLVSHFKKLFDEEFFTYKQP